MASGNIPYQCKHFKNNCVNPFQVLTNTAKCFPRMDCSEILFSLTNKNSNKVFASEKKNPLIANALSSGLYVFSVFVLFTTYLVLLVEFHK